MGISDDIPDFLNLSPDDLPDAGFTDDPMDEDFLLDDIGLFGLGSLSKTPGIVFPTSDDLLDGQPYQGNQQLQRVVIPDHTTVIASNAFALCPALTEAVIPDSVQEIRYCAFKGCTSLQSIRFPNALTDISANAFEGCSGLVQVAIPGSVRYLGKGAFGGCSGLQEVILQTGTREICSGAFSGCSSLTGVTLPPTLERIHEDAFSGCSGLTDITLPPTLERIDANAFSGCSSLTGITLPPALKRIEANAFSGCSGLTSITLPPKLERIDADAFKDCSSLTQLVIPDSVKTITPSAFTGCTGLESIVLPKSLKEWDPAFLRETPWFAQQGDFIISNDRLLLYTGKGGSVVIPHGVTEICKGAFKGCASLTDVVVPPGVQEISHGAFRNCENLRSIDLPQGICDIGYSAFRGCRSLTEITLRQGLIQINGDAFRDCASLRQVNLPQGLSILGTSVFEGCPELAAVELPQRMTYISYMQLSQYAHLPNASAPDLLVHLANQSPDGKVRLTQRDGFCIVNGVLIRYTGDAAQVVIPEEVTIIGVGAFHECEAVTSIHIPESVTVICDKAFDHCLHLTDIVIPGSVKLLRPSVFTYCKSLQSLVLPESLESLGMHLFDGCSALKRVIFPEWLCSLKDMDLEYAYELEVLRCPSVPLSSVEKDLKPAMFRGFSLDPSAYSAERQKEYAHYLRRNKAHLLTQAVSDDNVQLFAFCEKQGVKLQPALRDELIELATANRQTETLAWLLDYKNRTADLIKEAAERARAESQMLDNPFMAKFLRAEWRWSALEDGTIQIDKYLGKEREISIPPMVGRKPVTRIASDFLSYSRKVSGVIIPEGVTHIGRAALYDCIFLENLVLPQSLTHIGEWAFGATPWFRRMAPFPSVNGILLRYLPDYHYYHDEAPVRIPDDITHIGVGAFRSIEELSHIIIPEGVTHIDSSAFDGCKSLEVLELPNSLTHIGSSAFANCTSLQVLKLPNSLTHIGDHAFAGCRNLLDVRIPEGVTHIGDEAFRDCKFLRSATLPDSLESTGLHLFRSCVFFRHLNASESIRALLASRHSLTNELSGVTVAINGKLKRFKENEAFRQLVMDFEGNPTASISRRTTCLVSSDTTHPTRKIEQARELGIPILTEEEFFSRYFPAGIL